MNDGSNLTVLENMRKTSHICVTDVILNHDPVNDLTFVIKGRLKSKIKNHRWGVMEAVEEDDPKPWKVIELETGNVLAGFKRRYIPDLLVLKHNLMIEDLLQPSDL
jgi:hypothetical protein